MKQKVTKKLIVFIIMIGILISAAVPAMPVKAEAKKEVRVLATKTSEFQKYKYTYNKKGLLIKDACVKNNAGIPSYEYIYSGTKISRSFAAHDGSKSEETTYTYNKKGYLTKAASSDNPASVTKFQWKNGRCVKASNRTISYNKNGWVTKVDGSVGSAWVAEYDPYGYMISMGPEGGEAEGLANTYKNGRLLRQAALDQNGEEYPGAYTYKYTKISVPASVAEKVERQQAWLTNQGGMNCLPLAVY